MKPPTSWPTCSSRPTRPARRQAGEAAHDDLPFDLLDALAVESDPRMERMQQLMRERGWAGWTRLERLAEPPGGSARARALRRRLRRGLAPGRRARPGLGGTARD